MLVLLLCSRCCPDVVPILLVCLSSMCYVDRVLLLRCYCVDVVFCFVVPMLLCVVIACCVLGC